jgi:hypothetical protein
MNYLTFQAPLVMTALVLVAPTLTIAQNEIRTERVQFEPGASSATIESSITGYESVDYILRASKGQYMRGRFSLLVVKRIVLIPVRLTVMENLVLSARVILTLSELEMNVMKFRMPSFMEAERETFC